MMARTCKECGEVFYFPAGRTDICEPCRGKSKKITKPEVLCDLCKLKSISCRVEAHSPNPRHAPIPLHVCKSCAEVVITHNHTTPSVGVVEVVAYPQNTRPGVVGIKSTHNNKKICSGCGGEFEPKKDNYHWCSECYKKWKDKGRNGATHSPPGSYQEYIYSQEWVIRRDEVLRFYNHRCAVCKSGAQVQVHHNTYERFRHELTSDLVPLCNQCHKLYHHPNTECTL